MTKNKHFFSSDSIVAVATPPGGAISVVRVSGKGCVGKSKAIFSKDITQKGSHSLTFCEILEGKRIIDEVLVSYFGAGRSYTGEESFEISCHGSPYIVQKIMDLLFRNDFRMANAGEFTQRAYLNGKLDLIQAEAVVDIIKSETKSSHEAAMYQLRGGMSAEIETLRQELIKFAALIELELDFSEEDVEFASRPELKQLIEKTLNRINELISSFELGNAIKNGIPIAILGKPNAGKSTLLNTLLNDEKAIVSHIPGTTRDSIEDTININGLAFRIIDTAGLRTPKDEIEKIGIERSMSKAATSAVVIYLYDTQKENYKIAQKEVEKLELEKQKILVVGNKAETEPCFINEDEHVTISAKNKQNISTLKNAIYQTSNHTNIVLEDTLITNIRHKNCLEETQTYLQKVLEHLDQQTTHDFIAQDLRYALSSLAEITGEVSVETLLDSIFRDFCIGK